MSGFKYYTLLVCLFWSWQLNAKTNIDEFITYQPIISSLIPITDPAYSAFIIVKAKICQLGYHRYTQGDIEFAWRVLYGFIQQPSIIELLSTRDTRSLALRWLIEQLCDCFITAVGVVSEEAFAHYLISSFTDETISDKLHHYEQCFYVLYKKLRYANKHSEPSPLLIKQWNAYNQYLQHLAKNIEQHGCVNERIDCQHIITSLRFLLEMRRLSWQLFTSDCV